MNLEWLNGIFFKALNDLSKIDRQMGKETRTQREESLLDEINHIKDSLPTRKV